MFGYITANQQELKVRDFIVYRSYYCGLCHCLKERYGELSRLTLNYDLTFVALLLSSLDLKDSSIKEKRCIVHPLTKHKVTHDEYVDYAADMTVLLAYYKCQDDWKDNHLKLAWGKQQFLKHKIRKIEKLYPEKVKIIAHNLKEITTLEVDGSNDIDRLSSLFGNIMAEVMTFQNERWQPLLAQLGMHLGKFVYLMDAYEDLKQDIENNTFNPFILRKDDPEFESWIEDILTLQMAKVSEALDQLPIVENQAILENIIYLGVWNKYHQMNSKKEKV